MKKRFLGKSKLEVSAIGLGCMGFSQSYPPYIPFGDAVNVIRGAYDLGVTFFDTADVYGCGENEKLLGEALKPIRQRVVIATKCGFNLYDDVKDELGRPISICGRADYVKTAVEKSLQRLQTDYIDLYYLHRVDPNTPIEETAAAMADLIKKGKILNWGISEANANTVRRAHAVCPLAAVQSEYSLIWREPETKIFATLEELGIGLVPYCPLGRALLTGVINENSRFAKGDRRATLPMFTPEALPNNMQIVRLVEKWAKRKNITSAQFALVWLLSQKSWIVPIPGTTNPAHLTDFLEAANVRLSVDELNEFEKDYTQIHLVGHRADPFTESQIDK